MTSKATSPPSHEHKIAALQNRTLRKCSKSVNPPFAGRCTRRRMSTPPGTDFNIAWQRRRRIWSKDHVAAAFLRCAPGEGTNDMRFAGGFRFDRRGVLAAALAGLALSACGSSEESGETVAAAQIEDAVEKPNLTLGFIKLTDIAPLVIAKEKGFFEDEGLNVTLEPQANWKVLLDGVTGGELDGAHMLAGQILASSAGIGSPVKLVTPFSLDINGKAVTISNRVFDAIEPKLPRDADGKITHPVSAAALKPVVA